MDNDGKRNDFLEKKTAITKKSRARERIELLCDSGSFMEVGSFVKQRPTEFGSAADSAAEGVVTGWGTIDGAPVCVFSQDVSALGGAVSEMHAKKITALYDYALKVGIPVIGIFDSKGARIAEGVDALDGYAKIIAKASAAYSLVPQIAIISGICGGTAAVAASCFNFIIAVRGGEFFMSSPSVVAAVSGKPEIPAGAAEAAARGVADFEAASDEEAAALARALISYLPANSSKDKNYSPVSDDINRLVDISAMDGGEPRSVLSQIADNGTYLETGAKYAPEILTAFARFDGETVAVVGAYGAISASGAKKAANFINFANIFGISVLTIVNTPGFECSAEFESGGGISFAALLASAYAGAGVPMVTLITGKATGSAYVALGARGLGCDMVFAWPEAEISAMNAASAVALLCEEQLAAAADPAAERERLTREFADKLAAPYEAAKRGYVDEIIDPAQTRQAVVYALGLLSTKNI